MSIIDVVINSGGVDENNDFFETPLFTAVLSSVLSAGIAVGAILLERYYDKRHKKLQTKQEAENLKDFFYKISGALVIAIDVQIESDKATVKYFKENTFKNATKVIVSSFHTKRFNTIEPIQVFQAFTCGLQKDNAIISEIILSIYDTLDQIDEYKKSVDSVLSMSEERAGKFLNKYYDHLNSIATKRIQWLNTPTNNALSNEFIKKVNDIFIAYINHKMELRKKGLNVTEIDLQLTKEMVLDELLKLIANEKYRYLPPTKEIIEDVTNLAQQIAEYLNVKKYIESYMEANIRKLEETKGVLANDLKKLERDFI